MAITIRYKIKFDESAYFCRFWQKASSMRNEYSSYIKMAQTGHYSLFLPEWIDKSEIFKDLPKKQIATKTLKKIFKELEKHKCLNRKQTYLMSLDETTRTHFIKSFYCLVETKMISENKILQ